MQVCLITKRVGLVSVVGKVITEAKGEESKIKDEGEVTVVLTPKDNHFSLKIGDCLLVENPITIATSDSGNSFTRSTLLGKSVRPIEDVEM